MPVFLSLLLGAAVLPFAIATTTVAIPVAQELLNPQTIEQQARRLYELGRFSEAVSLWQQIAANFRTQGDSLGEAMALSNLSLTYQQLGQWNEATEAIASSMALIQNVNPKAQNSAPILAQALDVQGRLQLAQGKPELALDTWQKAAHVYGQIGDTARLARNHINQAQALQVQGLYRQAQQTLTEANRTLQKEPDSLLKVTGLRSLGNVLRVVGDLEQSQQVLQQSLTIAQAISNTQAVSDTLLSLGNTARTQRDSKAALEFYQQAATTPHASLTTQVQAQINQLSLLIDNQKWHEAQTLQSQIQTAIENLPASRAAIYARINFVQSLMKLTKGGAIAKSDRHSTPATDQSSAPSVPQSAAPLLAAAIQQSRNLTDQRAESYALGTLGHLYEQTKQLSDAQALTQKALLIAQTIAAPDISYQWQWQLGRLLWQRGNYRGAIAAYDEAVKALQSLRYDLVTTNSEVQFSFRENVEPVYREFVELLLQPEETSDVQQAHLLRAREVIESLQLAELDNFSEKLVWWVDVKLIR